MPARRRMPPRSVAPTHLGVVPGDVSLDLDGDADPLLGLGLQEGHGRVTDGALTVVFESHGLADRQDRVVVLDQSGGAHDLETFELVVGVAALDQPGDLGVPLEIQHLLALAEGPKDDLTVHHHVPHGHQMGVPRRPDGGHVEDGLIGEVGGDLGLCHGDGCALVGHAPTLALLPTITAHNRVMSWARKGAKSGHFHTHSMEFPRAKATGRGSLVPGPIRYRLRRGIEPFTRPRPRTSPSRRRIADS